ncbi:serine palmitoyltransferase [Emydomyces testavorans]|uniref:Serine palmitoyltransferase n=1 Tax=Emydomyces testavorans TaxID=2070801 RepID=A0AAF0DH41_9EURO|nr:serine palmitoyltransferase [Emydomyces testavorans]
MVHIAREIKVAGVSPVSFDPALLALEDPVDPALEVESDSVDSDMVNYVNELSNSNTSFVGNREVAHTGIESVRKYGIGPCSARWFYGSFDIFIQLERRLASLYPSLVAQSGKCRGMICGDAEITIGSTVATLVMPCSSNKTLNRVFIPNNAPHSVMAGANLNRPSKQVAITFYDTVEDIELPKKPRSSKVHATLYFETVTNGIPLDLPTFIRKIAPKLRRSGNLTGATIMFDDRNGLGKVGPQSLGYLNLMEAKHGVNFLRDALRPLHCEVEVLVAGSWFDAFGHQGGYVTGSASKVECLTWNTKAFFFSTPPMPLQAAISDRMLQILSDQSHTKKAVRWES